VVKKVPRKGEKKTACQKNLGPQRKGISHHPKKEGGAKKKKFSQRGTGEREKKKRRELVMKWGGGTCLLKEKTKKRRSKKKKRPAVRKKRKNRRFRRRCKKEGEGLPATAENVEVAFKKAVWQKGRGPPPSKKNKGSGEWKALSFYLEGGGGRWTRKERGKTRERSDPKGEHPPWEAIEKRDETCTKPERSTSKREKKRWVKEKLTTRQGRGASPVGVAKRKSVEKKGIPVLGEKGGVYRGKKGFSYTRKG